MRRAAQMSEAEAQEVKQERDWNELKKDMYPERCGYTRSLDSREEFQDASKKRPGWGTLPRQKIFTRYGALVINEVGQVASEKYGKSGVFLTGTIPGTGRQINDTVAAWSGEMVNRVRQWFRDWFTQEFSVINVWEFQSRGMLHIHIGVFSHEKRVLEKLLREWKSRWNKLLLEISDTTGVDLFRKNERCTWRNHLHKTQHLAQWINKSINQYLATYVTKTARDTATKSAAHPSRWWGCDEKTKKEAKQRRLKAELKGGSLLFAETTLVKLLTRFEEDLWEADIKEVPDVPGVKYATVILEPARSEEIWADIYRELVTIFGDSVQAEFGK